MNSEQDAPKEWLKVAHSANGATSVTCTLVQGSLSSKWSVKSYESSSSIKAEIANARAGAQRALDTLRDALTPEATS